MIAGQLELVMMANMARLADDMGKAKAMVGSSMKSIEGAVGSAKSVLASLGIGLGIGYFVTLVKGSIDAMDHLRDLSKTTNITVENLSGLQLAARQSGGDLSSIADSINKLSQNMGKDSEKFRALGITAKEPLEAFKQLADIYTKLENPQQRAAVMAAALGKSWAGAAPLLSEGGAKIQEMVDKGARLSGVTKEMTDEADKLNDKWAELTGTGGLLTRLVGPMLPLLNSLADGLLKVTEKSDGLKTSFSPLAEFLKVLIVLGAEFSFVWTTLGKDIARAVENVKLIAKGDFAGSRALGEVFRKDAEAAREALDAYTKTIMGTGLTGKAAPGSPAPDSAAAAAAAARAKAFLGDENAAKMLRDATFRAEKQVEIEEMAAQDSREAWQVYTDGRVAQDKAFKEGHEQMWKDIFKTIDDEQEAAIEQGRELMETIAEQEKKAAEEAARFGTTIDLAFDRAVRGGTDLLSILKDLVNELAMIEIKKRFFEPASKGFSKFLDELIKGGGGTGSTGAAEEMASLGIPQFAHGTDYVPRTGLAVLHQGERVVTAAENRGSGEVTIVQHINVDSRSDRASIVQAMYVAKEQAKAEIADSLNRGSPRFTPR